MPYSFALCSARATGLLKGNPLLKEVMFSAATTLALYNYY